MKLCEIKKVHMYFNLNWQTRDIMEESCGLKISCADDVVNKSAEYVSGKLAPDVSPIHLCRTCGERQRRVHVRKTYPTRLSHTCTSTLHWS